MQTRENTIPTITIVIPVYNVAAYVERCLLSVMRQTQPVSECIIVDDASPDDSISRCQQLIDSYNGSTRFVILHHGHNRGLSAARNTGTDAAQGEYIYYLDSDDEITPDCIEKLAFPILHDKSIEMTMGVHRVDISAMQKRQDPQKSWLKECIKRCVRLISHKNAKNLTVEFKTNEDLYKWYYEERFLKPVNVWNRLLKLSFIRSNQLYNKEGLLWEDCLWTYHLMRCLKHAVYLPDETYIQHLRPGSIITSTSREKVLKHFGYSQKEITSNVVHGERIKETICWMYDFFQYYIDASDRPDYQYAYRVYYQEMSGSHHTHDLCMLQICHYLSKSQVGRSLFKSCWNIRKRMVRMMRNC